MLELNFTRRNLSEPETFRQEALVILEECFHAVRFKQRGDLAIWKEIYKTIFYVTLVVPFLRSKTGAGVYSRELRLHQFYSLGSHFTFLRGKCLLHVWRALSTTTLCNGLSNILRFSCS